MSEPEKAPNAPEQDPYWWTPWAVMVAVVLFGLLGFLGKLGPRHSGPSAADVPATPAPGPAK